MITKDMLIVDWRDCWKWWSVRLAALIAAAPELYEFVPSAKDYLEPNMLHHIMAILAVLVVIGRITSQPKKDVP